VEVDGAKFFMRQALVIRDGEKAIQTDVARRRRVFLHPIC
jgi:hypothetical protein